jgi:VanZ family protein
LRYLPTILSTLLIIVAVILPGSQIPDVHILGIDKLAHFVLFSLWALCVRRDFTPSFWWPTALMAGIAFSWMTELLQIEVEGRTFDFADVVADTAGLAFGLLTGRLVLKWLARFGR